MNPKEPLPVNTTIEDIEAAAETAWAAGQFLLARDLVDTYLDGDEPYQVCMRCLSRGGALLFVGWDIRLCQSCVTAISLYGNYVTDLIVEDY